MWKGLKIRSEFFRAIISGEKTFEARKNDRNYQKGDLIIFLEWDSSLNDYTGNSINKEVTYVLEGEEFGIMPGYCVFGIK